MAIYAHKLGSDKKIFIAGLGKPGPAGSGEGEGIPGPPGPKGDPGDTPYIGENGNWWIGGTDTSVSASGNVTGVSSFNGRSGAVAPQKGDYTAEDVGAATMEQVSAAIQGAVLDSWEASY